jgi:hypothetical protein
MLILFTLLAGFVPLLQVTFFALLEDFYPGRLAVKDRDKTSKDHRRDPYHVVSDYWVYHRECYQLIDLRIALSLSSFQITS